MADSKVSDLTAASALTGGELFYGDDGINDVKVTSNQIRTFAHTGGAALSKTDDTNVTLTLGGTPTTALNIAASLTLGWTGVLAASRGGNGNGFFAVSGPGTSTKTFTLPNSSQSIACLDLADQTLSGGANVTTSDQGTKSSGTFTVDCGVCPLQKCVNNGAFTLAAPANDGSMILLVTNGASAGTITFSGFSVGAATGDALTTTNTQKFSLHIWRVGSISGYRVAAHQ